MMYRFSKWRLRLAFAWLACSSIASAAEPDKPFVEASRTEAAKADLEAVVAGARKEGEFRVSYGASILGGEAGIQEFVAGVNKKFNLSIKVSFTPGADIASMMTK